jgi:hypothetical protein
LGSSNGFVWVVRGLSRGCWGRKCLAGDNGIVRRSGVSDSSSLFGYRSLFRDSGLVCNSGLCLIRRRCWSQRHVFLGAGNRFVRVLRRLVGRLSGSSFWRRYRGWLCDLGNLHGALLCLCWCLDNFGFLDLGRGVCDAGLVFLDSRGRLWEVRAPHDRAQVRHIFGWLFANGRCRYRGFSRRDCLFGHGLGDSHALSALFLLLADHLLQLG